MTTALEEFDGGSGVAARVRRVLGAVRHFDLLDTIGRSLADAARVARAEVTRGRTTSRPRSHQARRGGGAARTRQHWLLISFIGLVASFTVAVVVLLVTGRLDNVYEAIYTWFPGRPWTHVMRDHPWLYVALVVPLAAVPTFSGATAALGSRLSDLHDLSDWVLGGTRLLVSATPARKISARIRQSEVSVDP